MQHHSRMLSLVRLCDPIDPIARQTSLSMAFSRPEYRSGLPYPPPGDLPDSGIKPPAPAAPALQADSLPLSHQGSPIVWYLSIILENSWPLFLQICCLLNFLFLLQLFQLHVPHLLKLPHSFWVFFFFFTRFFLCISV